MKPALFFVFLFLLFGLADLFYHLKKHPKPPSIRQLKEQMKKEDNAFRLRLQNKAAMAKTIVLHEGFSSRYAFFIDMHLPSGKRRFLFTICRKILSLLQDWWHTAVATPGF